MKTGTYIIMEGFAVVVLVAFVFGAAHCESDKSLALVRNGRSKKRDIIVKKKLLSFIEANPC